MKFTIALLGLSAALTSALPQLSPYACPFQVVNTGAVGSATCVGVNGVLGVDCPNGQRCCANNGGTSTTAQGQQVCIVPSSDVFSKVVACGKQYKFQCVVAGS